MSARASAILLAVLTAAGCGGAEGRPGQNGEPDVELVVTVVSPGRTERVELACAPGERSRACETARALAAFLARRPPSNRVCTQIYGGPEKAYVSGTIGGRRIERRFSKANGCEIADWKRAEELLALASGGS